MSASLTSQKLEVEVRLVLDLGDWGGIIEWWRVARYGLLFKRLVSGRARWLFRWSILIEELEAAAGTVPALVDFVGLGLAAGVALILLAVGLRGFGEAAAAALAVLELLEVLLVVELGFGVLRLLRGRFGWWGLEFTGLLLLRRLDRVLK